MHTYTTSVRICGTVKRFDFLQLIFRAFNEVFKMKLMVSLTFPGFIKRKKLFLKIYLFISIHLFTFYIFFNHQLCLATPDIPLRVQAALQHRKTITQSACGGSTALATLLILDKDLRKRRRLFFPSRTFYAPEMSQSTLGPSLPPAPRQPKGASGAALPLSAATS